MRGVTVAGWLWGGNGEGFYGVRIVKGWGLSDNTIFSGNAPPPRERTLLSRNPL